MTARDEATRIVERLRDARLAKGWSPERVALEARNRSDDTLTGMTIRRVEGGRYFPTLPSLIAWCRALNVPLGTST